MVNADPLGPKFHIEQFEPGEFRPNVRTFFYAPGFLITRTYALKAERVAGFHSGLRVKNKVFSNCEGDLLHGWTIEERRGILAEDDVDADAPLEPEPEAQGKRWRRGYWDAERSWEQEGPSPGDVNAIVRRHSAQKSHWPAPAPVPTSEIDKALSAAAQRLRTNSVKKRRQAQSLKVQAPESSTSNSSSSGSNSESSSDEPANAET